MSRRTYHLSLARQLILTQFASLTDQLLEAITKKDDLSVFQLADFRHRAITLSNLVKGTGRDHIEFYERATGKQIFPTKEEKKVEKERDRLVNLKRRATTADKVVAGTDYCYLESPVGSGKYVIYRGTIYLGTCLTLGEVIKTIKAYKRITNEQRKKS